MMRNFITWALRMNKSKRIKWGEHVAQMGEKWNARSLLVEKPEGKRPLGRTGRRWVDNIKMELRETVDLTDLYQDGDQWRALVNTVMNHRVPYNAGNFLSICTTGGLS
jgi:hypothetical protein